MTPQAERDRDRRHDDRGSDGYGLGWGSFWYRYYGDPSWRLHREESIARFIRTRIGEAAIDDFVARGNEQEAQEFDHFLAGRRHRGKRAHRKNRTLYFEKPKKGAAMISQRFTPEQVRRLLDFQQNPDYHPFTCPNRGEGHPEIFGDAGVLIPTVRGWICPFCDYTQDWAHDFMANEQPQKEQ